MQERALEPGHLIAGRYRVVSRLGAGGMGAVYEAEQLGLGRMVAVKVLLQQFSYNADISARFMREARAAAQIGHPGIVQVFDLGTDNGVPFLVMEKLEGEELMARIKRDSPLPLDWIVKMGVELADALQAAHDHGIVHRDLKPPNVFLARQGRRDDVVKVLDFGIAKLLHGADDIQTRTGAIFGTPMYMAPEQLRDSKDVDGRADVYALGCVLFQALTGKPPFQAPTYPDLVFRICSAPRPSATDLRSDIPPALSAVIARAMALEAQDRFASPAELARALGAPESAAPRPRAPESMSAVSAPTELASSAAALTPHSRTAPPIPTTALGGRALLGFAAVTAAAALGLALLFRPGASGDAAQASGSASADPSSVKPDPIAEPRRPATVPAEPAPVSTPALPSASVPAASSKPPRKNLLPPKPQTDGPRVKPSVPSGPTPPELVPQ